MPEPRLGALIAPHGLAEADGKIYFTGAQLGHRSRPTGGRQNIVATNIGADSISIVEAHGKE